MIELDRNIDHKSVISICKFFVDIDEPDHLVEQVIHDMEGIGYSSADGDNGMDQFSTAALSLYGDVAL